eukprot:519748-Prorocentrum_lima.AAC.1
MRRAENRGPPNRSNRRSAVATTDPSCCPMPSRRCAEQKTWDLQTAPTVAVQWPPRIRAVARC